MRSLLNSRVRLAPTLAIVITICSLWTAHAATTGDGGAAFLEGLSLSPVPSLSVVVCHGFGCAYRDQLVLTPARMSFLRSTLGTARSARDERKAIAGIVAWFDREGGRVAGTVGRAAYAGATTANRPAQMDCIDLTANITELLIVLDRDGLLKFHHVGAPVSRGFIIDGRQPHTTPVIIETAAGVQWSVDSWTKAYGQRPDIMTIDEWRNRD